jgi:amino acid transporter
MSDSGDPRHDNSETGSQPQGPAQGTAAGAGHEAGLPKGVLGMPEVLAQSIGGMGPSGAIAVLALLVFLNAQNGSWVSFAAAMIIVLCIGYCASQFARRFNSAGSLYVWVTRAFGAPTGFVTGWALQLGYLATGMATIFAFGVYGGDIITRLGGSGFDPAVQDVLYIVSFAFAVWLTISGIRLSTRALLVLEAISVTIIGIICVAVFVLHGSPFDSTQIKLNGVGTGGIVVGVVLAVFAFTGFEGAGALGLESKNPEKNVPRALLTSIILVGLFYIVVMYSQVYGFQGTKPGFAGSTAPLPDLASIVHLSFFAYILDVGILFSQFGATVAFINAAARVGSTMARDGIGVPAMTRVHPRFRTPYVSIFVVAIPMLIVPLILASAGAGPEEAIGWVGTVSAFGFILSYILVAMAAPVYLHRRGERAGTVAVIGTVGALALALALYANWIPQIPSNSIFPPLSAPYTFLPYIFLGWMALGIAWYALLRVRASRTIERPPGTQRDLGVSGGGDSAGVVLSPPRAGTEC